MARIETWAFRGKPDGKGGVLVLGREPPVEYRGALRQVEQSLTEIVELNRQILRQSREIERQKNQLGNPLRELKNRIAACAPCTPNWKTALKSCDARRR